MSTQHLPRAKSVAPLTPTHIRAKRRNIKSVVFALSAGILGLILTGLPAIALIASLAGGSLPRINARREAESARRRRRDAWPHVLDDLASAVRAGVPFTAALCDSTALAAGDLSEPLAQLAADIRRTGQVDASLRHLAAVLDDADADEVILTLRTIAEIGGSQAASMLGAVAASLREQAHLRGEIEARRTWVSTSAVLAVSAPWLTVLALATRRNVLQAYATSSGTILLMCAAAACVVGYVWMNRLGALPQRPSVVRR